MNTNFRYFWEECFGKKTHGTFTKTKWLKLWCGIHHPRPSLFSKVGSAPAFLEHPSFDSFPWSFPAVPYEFQKKTVAKKGRTKTHFGTVFFSFFGVFFRFRKGEFHGQGALVLLSAEKTSIGGLFNKSGSKQNAQNESSRWKYGVLLKKFSRINWWSFGSLQKTMYCFLVKYRSL